MVKMQSAMENLKDRKTKLYDEVKNANHLKEKTSSNEELVKVIQ